ncbi:MAG TPA: M1 family aminopeptidase [Terriglobales bacterium]|nr:M1 family aminopeptidase [Terriglobales bacterium]
MSSFAFFRKKGNILLPLLLITASAGASVLSGTTKDSTGAVVAHAKIEVIGGSLSQPLTITCDDVGQFATPDLNPGTYSLRVSATGFDRLERSVELTESPLHVDLVLALPVAIEEVTVNGKYAQLANSDPVYRSLRNVGLGNSFAVENFTFKCDVAIFQLKRGTLTFLSPVEGTVTGAIFTGEGHFNLKPITKIAEAEINRRTKSDQVDEDFTSVIFRYAGPAARTLLSAARNKTDTPDVMAALQHWRETVRQRREVPLGFSEEMLHGDAMENVDAEVLAALYNPERPGFFDAYMRGVKHKDLRFFFRPRGGAIPDLNSPEEVGLVNYDPEGMDDGVWYLDHFALEYAKGTASSSEEWRYVQAKGFKIETVIGKNDHLASVATITFVPLIAGERVIKFRLLPNLRVTRVSDSSGKDLYFIQESRKQDGSFYAIVPEPLPIGKDCSLTVEYSGDKVLLKAGNGSYYVRARESWYPNLNGFNERAQYDLTFKIPKRYKLISVGKLDREWTEGDFAASHWSTKNPIAVAGFNFGSYEKLELSDGKTGYQIDGYYLPELPDNLRSFQALAAMAPKSMTDFALQETRAQLQVCDYFFGKSGFDHIFITEQPDFAFGQSWPNLVYLPISAYMDSTQRWMLFGRIDNSFTAFVQEVTPHEVSHQWWGHAVGWASYHDQWLSEGFAEFSAALFLQQTRGKEWRKDYLEFWDRLQKRVLQKNQFGVSPNDAGPVWMGLRLISPRSENAYQQVTYAKGAYVLAMLRSMMYGADPNAKDADQPFINMMHDFVQAHQDRLASTESFKAIADKHITRQMDVDGNGKLDWFFKEWVYGTEVPRYTFHYDLTPAADGKTKLHMTMQQSEVDENFVMLVPVFADFGKGMVRLGQLKIVGNGERTADVLLPAEPKKVAYNAYKEILER